jgi:ppGpp synthetase/RelA/SpoT-type nucleotidyltranferase
VTSTGADAQTAKPANPQFDFSDHAQKATESYRDKQRLYEDFAEAVRAVVSTSLDANQITTHSIEARAKTLESFRRKAARPLDGDPESPKYADPIAEITDLAGVRVITFFLEGVDRASTVIECEFDVIEKTNKSSLLAEEERLGYQSIHYLVQFSDARASLAEYLRFRGLTVEVQVRTILQHAWAEIEHDIQYKSVEALPASIRRRFLTLAGLLEIGDREFQAIAEEDRQVRLDASRLIGEGRLQEVELTPDSLKIYLDGKYVPDGRMGDWNYGWNARALKRLGFTNLKQVDDCVAAYDDDRLSKEIWGSRQGQLQRFEDVLMVAMGENPRYWSEHPFAGAPWFEARRETKLEQARQAGFEVGSFDPRANN